MQTTNLILIGGGGHCKSVIDVAESAGFTILGILDLPEKVGKKILGYTIIGTDAMIPDYVSKALFIVTVGQILDPLLRIRIHEKIVAFGGQLAILIAPSAHISRFSEIGEGTVVLNHAVINADTKIGKGCIINTFANIEHEVIIGDYCHISTGTIVNGNCSVGTGTFIGSQATVVNGKSIADGCVVAAGAVVVRDLSQKGLYVGNPAILKSSLNS